MYYNSSGWLGGFLCLRFVLHEVKLTGSEGTVNILAMKTVVVMGSEPLVTQPAVVRPLSSVKSLVIDQNCFLRKPLATEGTLLLLYSRAGLLVSVEVVVGPEIFETNIAGELVVRLVCEHVLIKTPFASSLKLFPTDGASQKGSVVLQSFVDLVIVLMSPPTELTFELPVAPIALIWHLLTVDLSLVSLDLDLLSEPFITVLTTELQEVAALLLVLDQTVLVRKDRVTNFTVSFVFDVFLSSGPLTFTWFSLDLVFLFLLLSFVFKHVLVLGLHHRPAIFSQLGLDLGAALYDDLLLLLLLLIVLVVSFGLNFDLRHEIHLWARLCLSLTISLQRSYFYRI